MVTLRLIVRRDLVHHLLVGPLLPLQSDQPFPKDAPEVVVPQPLPVEALAVDQSVLEAEFLAVKFEGTPHIED